MLTNLFTLCQIFVTANAATLVVQPIVKSISASKYTTIQEAINAASPGDTIAIYPGTYKETLVVDKDSITIQGLNTRSNKPSDNVVVIENTLYGSASASDYDSATILVSGDNFKAYNLNFTNRAGPDGAAPAVATRGKNNAFYACGMHGNQGTFYPHQGSAFVGRCYIEGGQDFIYGRRSNTWLQGCRLGAKLDQASITFQGRRDSAEDGYFILDKARIVPAKSGIKVFLGRPWGDYARVIFQNSNLGNMIASGGWTTYSSISTNNVYFAEYSNTNGGGDRVKWAQSLVSAAGVGSFFSKTDWIDSAYLGASSP
ncbi:pectin lyase fold/virulence factor [Tricladium varicosporioides]|nr:pectin lyase fold/virulence factor [Hymenoscyphus varicosporioides]